MPKQKKEIKRKYRSAFYLVIISFLIGMFVGYASNNEDILSFFDSKLTPQTKTSLDPILIGAGEINTCFTPPAGCGRLIAKLISEAQESLYVQAYSFTSGEITQALINLITNDIKLQLKAFYL